MRWPPDLPDPIRRRILALWSSANDATSLSERTVALEALKQEQRDHDLSDVELSYIVEYERAEPSKLDGVERSLNVFEQIIELFRIKHIVVNFEQAVATALWILHTYVYDLFLHSPRLILRSKKPGCGKTAMLHLIEQLVDHGLLVMNTTAAVIYHRLKRQHTVFLIDQFEHSAFWRDDNLKSVIDIGYRLAAQVSRMEHGEDTYYPAYCPIALALVQHQFLRQLTPQLLSRSIIIDKERQPDGRDEIWPNDPQLLSAQHFAREWASTFKQPSEVNVPPSLVGRDANNWRVLLAVADSLGYGATARAVALALRGWDEDDLVTRIFSDIFHICEQRNIESIWNQKELLPALHALKEAPWDEFRGIKGNKEPHELTLGEFYDLVHDKGLRSKPVRKWIDGKEEWGKGFYRKDLIPIWTALGLVTPSQPNKIISLPRHRKRHSDGTDTNTKED